MKPTEIGEAYNQITHIWKNEHFDSSNGIKQHKHALTFIKNRGNALDIGCGCSGRFIDLLQKEGFNVAGLDVSDKMLESARKTHPSVTFYKEDICKYKLVEKYDFITAWDSIWHIPLEEHKNVIRKIVDSLNPGGVFIFSFGGTKEAGFHQNNTMGPSVYYSSLGTQGFLRFLLDLDCHIRHLEFDQYPALHAYLIVEKF